MHHLTHTGAYAGTPYCNINRSKTEEKGDTFSHMPYSNIDKFLTRPDICPECKKECDNANVD